MPVERTVRAVEPAVRNFTFASHSEGRVCLTRDAQSDPGRIAHGCP
jgi:hypothetical protein